MNKTISITLAGLAFTVEEDAYPILEAYLASVKKHFATFSYGNEVYGDIEARLAEQFSKRLHETKLQVISKTEVESAIKEMGTIEELSGAEQPETAEPAHDASSPTRRLYRDTDNAIIGGVAAGIAAYFGLDPLVIRIIFVIASITGGWGIALYIILWIAVPEAKTPSEKLEMRGKAGTAKELEKMVKDRIESVRSGHGLKKLFNFFKAIFKGIFRVIAVIVGLGITIGAAFGFFMATFFGANLFFNRQSPYLDQSIAGAFPGIEYHLLIILAFLAVAIPLAFIAVAGSGLIRRRNYFNPSLAFGLAAVWFVSAIGASVIVTKSMPAIQSAVEKAQGSMQTKEYKEFKDFKKLEAGGLYDVTIQSGKEYSISAKGYGRDLEEMTINKKNDTLVLSHSFKDRPACMFCSRHSVAVTVTMPLIDYLKISGSSEASISGFTLDMFGAELSGASRLSLDSTIKKLALNASGASDIDAEGKAENIEAKASGASRINAGDLESVTAKASASGSSDIILHVTKELSAEASGASSVSYYGNPKITYNRHSGSSDILQIGE